MMDVLSTLLSWDSEHFYAWKYGPLSGSHTSPQPIASTRSGTGMYLQIQQPESPHLRLNIWWTDTVINPEADWVISFPSGEVALDT